MCGSNRRTRILMKQNYSRNNVIDNQFEFESNFQVNTNFNFCHNCNYSQNIKQAKSCQK